MRRLANVIGVLEALVLVVGAGVMAVVASRVGWSSAAAGTVAIWLMLAVTAAVGWLLAGRLPRNPLGWLLLLVAGFFLAAAIAYVAGLAVVDVAPGLAAWLFWYASGNNDVGWVWLPPIGLLFTQVPLRFPDGRLPSPRWRPFSWFTVLSLVVASATIAQAPGDVHAGLTNPIGASWLVDQPRWLVPALALTLMVAFVGSAASVVVRYRRADVVTRTQIRWFAWAVVLVIGFYLVSFVVPGSAEDTWVVASYTLIPASIGVAVLRYRLYDIDRVISRTTAYALVTGIVVSCYLAVVTAISHLLPASSSSLAVAAATLTAAALFRPVLVRVQRWVDRRFDRSRYDALREAAAFTVRLRDEVDPDAVGRELLGAVHTTLAPSTSALWLRPE